MTQWPEYVKILKDIMKFVTDQQFEDYKLKFIPDCLRQWNIDLYILLEWIAEEQLPKFYKKV